MKTDLFQSCGHCWVFQICWHIECNTFTASSFRIWKSSTGFPSPQLALFVVMLPKAYFTSRFMMSGSRWVITPSWLFGSWRSFLYSSSVYPLENEMVTHSSILAWRIPWMEKTGRLQSMGSQRVRHDWADSFPFTSLRFQWVTVLGNWKFTQIIDHHLANIITAKVKQTIKLV